MMKTQNSLIQQRIYHKYEVRIYKDDLKSIPKTSTQNE